MFLCKFYVKIKTPLFVNVYLRHTINMEGIIALEEGRIFKGRSFGAKGESFGEVVFNTSMTGYQEILTDPSYKGQIVVMTFPEIGNYGINQEDLESRKPFVEGFIVKEYSKIFSNWRANSSLDEFLKKHNIIGLEGVDTRALTRYIREKGSMRGVVSTYNVNPDELVKKAKGAPPLMGRDLVKEVSVKEPYLWSKEGRYKVVVLDCGVKYNILRTLQKRGCKVIVVPPNTKAEEILLLKPQGFLLSNGPGDPEGVPYVVETTKALIGKIPMFGICLGHQILSLALQAKTYKLKFGHHGANHPVKDLKTGKIYITVQNHNFCVDIDSLDKKDIEITHINLNDQTLEGMRHKSLPILSVQFHPEASPGPHDAHYLFEEFIKMMNKVYVS